MRKNMCSRNHLNNTTDKMKVSIIVPVYNVEKYVEECLRSVMGQTYGGDIECIVVDDCGSDGSMDVARRVIGSYSGPVEFKIVSHEANGGLSAARNSGIRVATGDYLTFLDSDDHLLPDSLKDMAAVVEKYPGVDIVQGDMWLKKPTRYMDFLCVSPVLFPEYSNEREWCSCKMLTEIPMTACGKLVRRNFIVDNGLYFCEGILHEDDMWRVQAARHIRSVAFCFTPIYYYRNDNDGSIIHRPDKTRSFYSRLKILEELIGNFGKADFKGECRYAVDAMMYANKANVWPQIKDKELIKKELKRLNEATKRSDCPGLLKFMARYLTLPVAIGNNMFTRPFYLSYVMRQREKLKS